MLLMVLSSQLVIFSRQLPLAQCLIFLVFVEIYIFFEFFAGVSPVDPIDEFYVDLIKMIAPIKLSDSKNFHILHREVFDLVTFIFLWQGNRI